MPKASFQQQDLKDRTFFTEAGYFKTGGVSISLTDWTLIDCLKKPHRLSVKEL